MKKIKFDSLKLNPKEILSRVQLRSVMGGDDGSGGSSSGGSTSNCPDYNGYVTTSPSCPCGIDITKSTSDYSSCCLSC
jgi:hypothetical protein